MGTLSLGGCGPLASGPSLSRTTHTPTIPHALCTALPLHPPDSGTGLLFLALFPLHFENITAYPNPSGSIPTFFSRAPNSPNAVRVSRDLTPLTRLGGLMAAAYTVRGSPDDIAIGEMSNVTTARLATPIFPQDIMAGSVGALPSPHINLPPPNPPFTFPSRPSSSAPSSLSRTTGRRHQSAIDIPKIGLGVDLSPSHSPSAVLPDFHFNPSNDFSSEPRNRRPRPPPLPDFTFNPGADSSFLSPSTASPSPRAISHMGHRRGGSEFVGGTLKPGESITVMSTSPTKSESEFASPTLTPSTGPRRHQRGHSHRRSGAISSHDLSLILQTSPNPSSRGSSAPASPAGFRDQQPPFKINEQHTVEPASAGPREPTPVGEHTLPEKPTRSLPELSPKPPTRTRVGFSDTLEFIPRPLSLVSTDTASTVRPGHSVSGSISSIASMSNAAITDRDLPIILGSSVPLAKSGSRPSTAGAILERTSSLHVAVEDKLSPKRRNSILILNDLAQANHATSAVSTPTKTPRRWTFFGFDSFATTGSPTKPRLASTSSPDTTKESIGTECVTSTGDADFAQVLGTSRSVSPSGEKKKSGKKRQKKVKSWAGSILPRKSKSRGQKSKARRRSQTPPTTRVLKDEDQDCEFYEATDQSSETDLGHNSDALRELVSQPEKRSQLHTDDEAFSPMIDLDAALGPFNTPTRDPKWEEAQRAGMPPKRQLHSAAGMRGFSGPGMHYHRRAESAPEMPPFEGGRFSMHRFGSSSTMADVFEEDEEEDEEEDDQTGESAADDSTSESQDTNSGHEEEDHDTDAASTPRQEHSTELAIPTADVSTSPSMKSKKSSSSLGPPVHGKGGNDNSSSNLHNDIIAEEGSYFVSNRREAIYTTPLETSITTVPSPGRDRGHEQKEFIPPDATSIILSGPPPTIPISPYSISHSSSFPSPRSPMSYDPHRISTAPSSVTDDNNFRSLLMGEPGPELVRLSIDVPPSLASTNSTTTRDSSFIPGVRPRNKPFQEQRPASFTSTAFGRRRSSLASLSRLISSAHGERSKLSTEVPFDNEAEKKSKTSKSKRLTRLMQFWKPKASNDS
ncbi:hypothetical protein F5B22DRAFT_636534 [Xylaria bambusicola]|uniref:uncharacterized protein n=1 Tax=Xylaria bambusicola TaxID=326684 RepID=UPI0020076411|nr:uncharacterized protein F5B22DRAFT_636534 [Xylaria bambusicola]KAI0515231.1 hypothetical protein F5B22DRAFT_636534 [Xylaria bambusicola]